jgi:hypothetical protein
MLHRSAPASTSLSLVVSSSQKEDRFVKDFGEHHDEWQFQQDEQLRLVCLENRHKVRSATVAGIEALVFGDGAVTLPARKFRDLLKTYKGARFLSFEWGADGLHVQNSRLPVIGYDPRPKPPADFHVFPVIPPPGSTTHRQSQSIQ